MSLEDLMAASHAGTPGSDTRSVAKTLINEPSGTDQGEQRNEPRERGERRVVTRERNTAEEDRHVTVDEDEDDEDQDDLFRSPSNRQTNDEGEEEDETDDDPDNRSQEDEDDDTDSGTGDEGEESEYEDLSDDTLIPVTIDGEETELTLAELKRRAAGEGAIERRLQEATELRRSLEQERHEHTQNVEHDRGVITAALQLFQDRLFHPRVQQPDPNLRNSDPQEYARQFNEFQADQQRLQGDMQQFQQVMQTFQQQEQQQQQQMRVKEANLLRDKMPVFKDPVQGPKMRERIINTAKQYGFSEKDVASAVDHRLFLMAADAAAYRDIMAQQKGGNGKKGGKNPPAKGEKRIRTMRPGGKAAATRGRAKQEQSILDRARKTGDVKDVARTLIQAPPTRRR